MTSTPNPAESPHIVVGIDGSEPSYRAAEWAAHEAARRSLPVRLVSCYSVPLAGEPGMVGTYAVEAQVDAIRDEHDGFVDTAVKRVREAVTGLRIERLVTLASPSIVLPKNAEPDGLLVVGSSGRSGRFVDVLGSVATAACHHASVPVVVVPATSSKRGSSMKKIVVGTDGSESARHALEWAYEEARLAGAELVVVHSWEYPYPETAGDTSGMRERMRRDAERELDESVSAHTARAGGEGVTLRKHLVESPPAKALIDESEGADLVVVGSRGRGGFASMLLGSVSRAVVQHAHCPIAVIRHPKH